MISGANESTHWASRTGGLSDFQPLLAAEDEIVSHLHSGDFDRLGDGSRPVEHDAARIVRAPFLRFLMLGGDQDCRPHEKGVRISGAWITGILDLEACRVFRDIGLNNCHFEEPPVLRAAIINRLFLNGSSFAGLRAERLEARGGIYLRGALISDEVNISESRLGGNLECDGAVIRAETGCALNAAGLEIRSVLARGARLQGGINLSGARLGADFDCSEAIISNAKAIAIDASEIQAGGSVVVRSARVEGEMRLVASQIAGDLDCTDAGLLNPDLNALDMSRAAVGGAFFLRGEARIDGVLAMTGASIGTMHDQASCWPRAGNLLLNRCQYGAFIDSPVDAKSRLEWLARQTCQSGEDFWPQPYEQLAAVFREMGHVEDSRTVLLVKERLQRRARRARARNPVWRAIFGLQDGILAVTVGYGRQPLLALVWLLFFWALGVGVFANAERFGAIKPNGAVVLRSPEWTLCGIGSSQQRFLLSSQQLVSGLAQGGQTQLECFLNQPEAASYPAFNPWMYSLDTLLPVLEMGQKAFWRPNQSEAGGGLAISYFYFHSVVGWALSLLAVAGFSGLVKSQ
jgi:hypothetical protein